MATRTRDLSTTRIMVGWASAIGIAIVFMGIIIGNNDDFVRVTGLFVLFGSPFLLALVSILLPLQVKYQCLVWLIAGIGALIPGFLLIFSGIGIFILGIAVLYQWAAFRTGLGLLRRDS